MTDTQILTTILASVPSVVAVLVGILINNSRLGDTNARLGDMNARLGDTSARMEAMRSELRGGTSDLRGELRGSMSDLQLSIAELRSHMDNRFDDLRDMWRADLRRVEEVTDLRLKHLEER